MPLLSNKEERNLKLSSIPLPKLRELAGILNQSNRGNGTEIIKRLIDLQNIDDKLDDFIRKSPLFNNSNEFISKLRQLINKVLKKLIKLKETQPDILQDINQLHKQSKKIKKVEYLEYLGESHKKQSKKYQTSSLYLEGVDRRRSCDQNCVILFN